MEAARRSLLLDKHTSRRLHHVLHPQGLQLKYPPTVDLPELGASGNEDALVRASAWVVLRSMLMCVSAALPRALLPSALLWGLTH